MDVSELSSTNRTMRIMHVASGDLWAGAEVQLYTLVKSLAAIEGNELYVVLMNEGELSKRLQAIGVAVLVLDESRYSALQIFSRLKAHMLDVQPQVVHTHRLKENIIGALANVLSVNAYCLRTVHGAPEFSYSFFSQAPKWLISRFDRFLGRYLQKKVVAVSEPLAGLLQAYYPPSHIGVVLNGVDEAALASVERASLGSELGDGEGVKHIGIVGRLVPVKRIDLFLGMAKALMQEGGYRFHVVGDGPLSSGLKKQAEDLGVSDVVYFYGHRTDAASLIKAMDVLVMCSDHEGLPMTALESIALGTPMVAHAVGGLVPLLSGVKGCELVEGQHVDAYLKALRSVLLAASVDVALPEEYTAKGNAGGMMALYRAGI